jgi:hypothetical protein
LKCWGLGEFGALGNGETVDKLNPTLTDFNFGVERTVTQLEVGWHHSCVVLEYLQLKCWGYNDDSMGRLGTGFSGTQLNRASESLPVSVQDEKNVGEFGYATSSSTHGGFYSSYAIDGTIGMGMDNVAITDFELNPWWQVRLDAEYAIDEVRIYNREDCCAERLVGFVLTIERNGVIQYNSANSDTSESSVVKDMYSYSISGIVGDTVKIQLFKTEYLQLTEVLVLQSAPRYPNHLIVCGAAYHYCNTQKAKISHDFQLNAVRCCSDTSKTGWVKHAHCNVWARSEILGVCYGEETYESATNICASVNARLCTREELKYSCTRGSGCGLDNRMIWSSTTSW